MIAKFLGRRARGATRGASAVPDKERIYAIGDIHGRLDLLDKLLAMIEAEEAAYGGPATLLLLGDLVDRGPQSAQVVERVMGLEASRPPGTVRCILGNHEEVFLAAVQGDERAFRFFTKIGGCETILSYGVTDSEYRDLDYPALMQRMQELVPAKHIEFLSRFEDLIVVGDYAFVHAGIRPEEPLARQKSKDLRWIRDDFLNYRGALEKVVVHGHTISDEVEDHSHRIGLDTGAYASGKLTAMGFEATNRWIVQAVL